MLHLSTIITEAYFTVNHCGAINPDRVLTRVNTERLARKCCKGLNARTDTAEFNHYFYRMVPAVWKEVTL